MKVSLLWNYRNHFKTYMTKGALFGAPFVMRLGSSVSEKGVSL